ncbi:MAG: cytochrome c oxidase subunit 3 [Pseudomonadota bacterium]
MATPTDNTTYYVPDQSKLPLATAISISVAAYGAASGIHGLSTEEGASWLTLIVGLLMIAACLYVWFKETIVENSKNLHSTQLKGSYRLGMQWFIFSEVMFFAAFFGALFYIKYLSMPWLAGEGEGGSENGRLLWEGYQNVWPSFWAWVGGASDALVTPPTIPQEAVGGVAKQLVANNGEYVNAKVLGSPWKLPFLNTLLLVSSSFTVHWAHHAIKHDDAAKFKKWMIATLLLGLVFIGVQGYEYYEAYHHLGLTLKSGVYGSTFFMLTGFHGFHVCMGAFILLVQTIRGFKGHFKATDHFGFEAGSWYWHFVDVVWIFLFLVVYLNIF